MFPKRVANHNRKKAGWGEGGTRTRHETGQLAPQLTPFRPQPWAAVPKLWLSTECLGGVVLGKTWDFKQCPTQYWCSVQRTSLSLGTDYGPILTPLEN